MHSRTLNISSVCEEATVMVKAVCTTASRCGPVMGGRENYIAICSLIMDKFGPEWARY